MLRLAARACAKSEPGALSGHRGNCDLGSAVATFVAPILLVVAVPCNRVSKPLASVCGKSGEPAATSPVTLVDGPPGAGKGGEQGTAVGKDAMNMGPFCVTPSAVGLEIGASCAKVRSLSSNACANLPTGSNTMKTKEVVDR